MITSLAELRAQLSLNHGWLFLHIGATRGNSPDSSARAFESARRNLEDALPITLLRCVLLPSELLSSSLATGLDPNVHAFFDGRLIESVRAPRKKLVLIQWAELLYSFHTPDPPRVLLEPPSEV